MIETQHGHFLPVGKTQLYYEVAGEGEPLLFIHAGICDARMWDDQWEHFAQSYQVVRFDMRGFGRTPNPTDTFKDIEDIHALLTHLNIAKTHIVACSFGGKNAIDFALAYPDMVDKLVVVGSALGGFEYSAEMQENDALEEEVFEKGGKFAAVEHDVRSWVDGPKRQPHEVDMYLREKVREMDLNTFSLYDPDNVGKRVQPELEAFGRLHELLAPTLAIYGELEWVDMIQICEAIASIAPHARSAAIEGTCHLPNMERPDIFNEIVGAFLKE